MKALIASAASASLFIVPCQSAKELLPIEFTDITRNYQVSPNDFKTDAVVNSVNFDNFLKANLVFDLLSNENPVFTQIFSNTCFYNVNLSSVVSNFADTDFVIKFAVDVENSQQTIIDDIQTLTTVRKMQEPSNLKAIGIFGKILLSSITHKTFSGQKK